MHWWVSDETVARLVPHIQGLCGRFPSINVRVEPVERKRFDGRRLLVLTDTSPRGLPERVLTCKMAAESIQPLLQPLPQAAGAQTPVQQNPAARGASGDSRAGNSAEEKWLAALLAVIKSKRGQPLDLAVLANKAVGGVARPDGVNIKLRDFLTMHARRCGLVLASQPDSSGNGVTWTVALDPNGASSSGRSTAPADRAQRSEQAPDPVGEGGDANVCNICFEEQCDTRMVPCLHKICHNCVQVPRLFLSLCILLYPSRVRLACHARSRHHELILLFLPVTIRRPPLRSLSRRARASWDKTPSAARSAARGSKASWGCMQREDPRGNPVRRKQLRAQPPQGETLSLSRSGARRNSGWQASRRRSRRRTGRPWNMGFCRIPTLAACLDLTA